jgi:hypothetical protein
VTSHSHSPSRRAAISSRLRPGHGGSGASCSLRAAAPAAAHAAARRLQPSHLLQVAAQCLLVQEAYGVRPPYGVVPLSGRIKERVPFTPTLERQLLATMARYARVSGHWCRTWCALGGAEMSSVRVSAGVLGIACCQGLFCLVSPLTTSRLD